VWLMQLEAQTSTRGILEISADALEVLLQYIRRFRSGRTFFYNDIKSRSFFTLGFSFAIYYLRTRNLQLIYLFDRSVYMQLHIRNMRIFLPFTDKRQNTLYFHFTNYIRDIHLIFGVLEASSIE